MRAPLTPERLAATYDYLRVWPPFSRWGLPESDAIKFRTTQRKDAAAEFKSEPLEIMVSLALNYHLMSVMQACAHEMIHLHQSLLGSDNRYQHNEEFMRLAKLVCKRYSWDLGQFVGGC